MKKKSISIITKIMLVMAVVVCSITMTKTSETHANNLRVGDVLGNVLNTDIRVFIDDVQIMGYNIGGWTYVVAEELAAYGFAVHWNPTARTLEINRGASILQPQHVPANLAPIGSIAFPFLHTDIVTHVRTGSGLLPIHSYNINGRTVVRIDDVAQHFGTIHWNPTARQLRVTTTPITPVPPIGNLTPPTAQNI
ncbi:MAG: hypothetical protein FWC69_04495, partial [Defluviitaleaceae bacterium]|nr:hypothetical protein [Defluviitaleaceae bacterium]